MTEDVRPCLSVVMPCYNEATTIEDVAKRVLASPYTAELIIVDDGSTDETAAILDRYATKYPWISAIHLPNRGSRKPGGGVIEAFHRGYQSLKKREWEFIVKLEFSYHPVEIWR